LFVRWFVGLLVCSLVCAGKIKFDDKSDKVEDDDDDDDVATTTTTTTTTTMTTLRR